MEKCKCDKCNGRGYITTAFGNWTWKMSKICSKCKGAQNLDWVEMITGRKEGPTFKNKTTSSGPR